jgi:hypothetical protein
MAAVASHTGARIAFWALGSVLCAACSVWCIVQMVRMQSVNAGLLTLALFWGFAMVRACEYLLAARRGDAHVGHSH